MKSIARQLNGRINLYKGAGHYATWYIPAVIGLYNVYDAAPEMRVRTLFEEGFGILGGYAGAVFGAEVIGLGIVTVFCLGPIGAFLTIFFCASVFGLIGSAVGRTVGSDLIYDFGSEIYNEQFYHSPEQILEGLR